jgi:hypothetical protein
MLSLRGKRTTAFALMALAVLAFCGARSHAQAALLMEEPYGLFGNINPTGHNAIYLQRVCAETPVKLRRCEAGEPGAVISRYQGMGGYDWVAIPLIPYLYSVETESEIPLRVDRPRVLQLRNRYHETHLLSLGENLPAGNLVSGGWTELVGVAYERRIYAFRFDTTEEQDDALIAGMNAKANRTHFHMLYNNCADFARVILNTYFPGSFKRSIFPDAGMTTPKQIAYKLARYARKHPETQLAVLEIPQVPGYRRHSSANKSVAESLTTTAYAVPITLWNPYLAGGLFVDYLARGRFHSTPKHPQILVPGNLLALTAPSRPAQNPDSAGIQAPGAAADGTDETPAAEPANSSLREIKATHE